MRGLSVVIPSKTKQNFEACTGAIRHYQENVFIVGVDDGDLSRWFPGDSYCILPGTKPFCFSRNINIGIKQSADDDVVILNDDALLQTPGGFSLLQRAAEEHPEYGVIAATTNNAGNTNQYPKGIGLREDPRMVCFVCVLIPRRTIEAVGLLDERFVHYGLEDDDYCLRVRNAGLKIGIHDGCFVDHKSLKSTFRGQPGGGGNYFPNLEIFKEKWGMDNFGRPVAVESRRQ